MRTDQGQSPTTIEANADKRSFSSDVSDHIRRSIWIARGDAHLTQAKLAEQLGNTRIMISNWERVKSPVVAVDLALITSTPNLPILSFFPPSLNKSTSEKGGLSGQEQEILLIIRKLENSPSTLGRNNRH